MRTQRGRPRPVTSDHLRRVLELEARRGCDNRACVGGTDALLLGWLAPAAERSRTPTTRSRLESLAEAWETYPGLPTRRRAAAVAAALGLLDWMAAPAGGVGLPAPVASLPGIGPGRAFALASAGILTVEDLLLVSPAGYLDASSPVPCASLDDGVTATVRVRILREPRAFAGLKVSRAEARAGDGTGEVILVWFRQPYRAQQLTVGDTVTVSGKASRRQDRMFLVVAATLSIERADQDGAKVGETAPAPQGLVAEYPAWLGLPSKAMRDAVRAALAALDAAAAPVVPADVARERGLLARPDVFRALHMPETRQEADRARRSLAYERLLALQARLLLHRRQTAGRAEGAAVPAEGLAERIEALSGLRLTGAQRRVLEEVAGDLRAERPACRLIHGDVGCGKTLVAAGALLAAAQAGRQAAMMAPTEMLAEQHFLRLRSLLAAAGVSVHLLTGSLGRSARGPARAAAEGGEPGVWVGTHALIQEAVAFADLAVVAVDEQHRFGVAQRARLAGKASAPNLIAMSATPIPRTLALALYADFDLSVVDELPPGRQPVATRLLSARSRDTAYAALRETAEGGQQGFVVCPLIEPSPALEAEAATEHVEALRAGPLAGLRLGLVHGRMPPDERQAVMEAFYGGLVDVLVSTTVIEVGLDVPNASAIVVENAERFGLAQLHQLRGRVARSRHRPRCFLLKGSGGEEANRRLEVLVQTEDGFRIAEADLEQRGAGELAGLRQHGAGDWLVGDVLRHPDLLAAAREDAAAILGADPALGRPEHAGLAAAVGAMAPVADGGWAL